MSRKTKKELQSLLKLATTWIVSNPAHVFKCCTRWGASQSECDCGYNTLLKKLKEGLS